ncbi:MAG: cupin domain-containing protein [Pseudomonadota bacterium]
MLNGNAIRAVAVDAASCPLDTKTPEFGSVNWRTLVSGEAHQSQGLVAGMAEFGPADTLKPHRHGPPEVYFCTEGSGVVRVDGEDHLLRPGMTLYIPPNAEHSVVAGPEGLKFFYTFPVTRFDEVDYQFSALDQGEAVATLIDPTADATS